MPTPARALALAILRDLDGGGSTLAEALARPEALGLPPRERAFLHELVLGTLRRRGNLDHALGPLLDRPLERIDPPVRLTLRLGAHQILNLRVPDRAAVTESVELVRALRPRATGFVNAVLRRLAREGAPPPPDPVRDPHTWLTTVGSLPRWLAERWIQALGPEAAVERARAFGEEPPVTYRTNPRVADAAARLEAGGVSARPGLLPGEWRADGGRPTDLAAEGVVYLQDTGSQLVARLCAGPGIRLDACAAPGGKALLMADLAVAEEGVVVAAEGRPRRLLALRTLAQRWGAPNLRILAADGLHPPFRSRFPGVLLDAPCSGLGTIGRHPDIRWRARPEDLRHHAARQGALLESLSPLVAPGGVLVYSVCSAEPEETLGVVKPFLDAHPEFALGPLPAWAALFAGPDGFARTSPERHQGDAFFAALLVLQAGESRPKAPS